MVHKPIEMKALSNNPLKSEITSLSTLGFFLPSDAGGYVLTRRLNNLKQPLLFISWIGGLYYLLDEEDTLDKVNKNQLLVNLI